MSTTEIYLGDYVDRGNQSRGVIECLLDRATRARTICLRGNHETLFEQFLDGELPFDAWKRVGGAETLASYGLDGLYLSNAADVEPSVAAAHVPAEHRKFLCSLRDCVTIGSYCFVHAGLRPSVILEEQSLDDMTTIRKVFLDHVGDFGYVIVHGHTPVGEVDFRPNRINLDTGAYLTNRLSVLKIGPNGPSLLGDPPDHRLVG